MSVFLRLKSILKAPAKKDQEGASVSAEEATASIRKAWNQAAEFHKPHTYDKVQDRLDKHGHMLHPDLLDAIASDGIPGKRIAVLSCNNGRAVLSLAKLGAKEAVGFDISEEFIQQGRELAEQAELECELVAVDIHDIPADYNDRFDLVLITAGSLFYYPDLQKSFAVIHRILKNAGRLIIHEIHPIMNVFPYDKKGHVLPANGSYFANQPVPHEGGLDYYSYQSYDSEVYYTFPHRLDTIIQSSIDQGLNIRRFEELHADISSVYGYHKRKFRAKVPRSYLLVSEKA